MAFLDAAIRRALDTVERNFLFRKTGLPFDYASDPDDFPSRAFANAREARSNLPNPSGLGGGYHYSCRNHALLFDAYLLRLELGIESQGDEDILDRLIGGLIRLDTVAPKSFLVGGLSADGRGFYAQPRLENHAAWIFSVSRGLGTAAIAPESQEKFRSIVGKWLDRLRREKFHLHTVDNKPVANGDFAAAASGTGPQFLAMLLVAAAATGEEKDRQFYVEMAEEQNRIRLSLPRGAVAREDVPALLWRQTSLALLAARDDQAERQTLVRAALRENALAVSRWVASWREWDPELAREAVDWEWRRRPKVPLEESPLGFLPPDSWKRLDNENALTTALNAMYILLLAGDPALIEPHAADMEECLGTIPWESIVGMNAIAPVAGIHARGVEAGVWDKTLYDSLRIPPASETSFAAKYMEPDYDSVNPDRAGHRDAPPGKRRANEPGEKGDGRRRRRRKRK